MVTRTRVILEDDLDGGPADGTVEFGLDGSGYAIDLSSRHAEELRGALAPWLAVARRVSPGRRRVGRAPTDPAQLKAKRDWAAAQGFKINAKGRIPQEVEEAYAAAHGGRS